MTYDLVTDSPFQLDIKPAVEPVKNPNTRVKMVGTHSYEYEIYQLVDEYDDVLRQPAEHYDFEKNSQKETQYLALSMLETMKAKHGIGLAAPQVGKSIRMFVMGGAEGVAYAMFNPIVLESGGKVKMQEGCLSSPGLFLTIEREEWVKVAYFDMDGNAQEKTFNGLTARVCLHELDHLYGTCFTSLVSPIVLERAKRKVKKNLKLLKAQREENKKKEIIAQAVKNLYQEGLKQKHMGNDQIFMTDAGFDPNANLTIKD